MEPITKFAGGGGPVIPAQSSLCFHYIACGALSGFHAIIGTAPLPKMIGSERDNSYSSAYGGMLLKALWPLWP